MWTRASYAGGSPYNLSVVMETSLFISIASYDIVLLRKMMDIWTQKGKDSALG